MQTPFTVQRMQAFSAGGDKKTSLVTVCCGTILVDDRVHRVAQCKPVSYIRFFVIPFFFWDLHIRTKPKPKIGLGQGRWGWWLYSDYLPITIQNTQFTTQPLMGRAGGATLLLAVKKKCCKKKHRWSYNNCINLITFSVFFGGV